MFSGEILLKLYYAFTKYLFQQICYALCRLNRGDHQKLSIHVGKVDVVSSVADQLCQEGTLGSAVAFPERMQLIGHTIEVYDFLHEFIVRQTFEIIAIFQTLKNQLRLTLNILRKRKPCSFLADIHRPNLTSPVVQIREEKMVNAL